MLKFYCPLRQKRIRKNCGTRDRREARRILRECRERLLNGKYIESAGAITQVQEQTVAHVRKTIQAAVESSATTWQDCYERYRSHRQTRVRDKSLIDALSRVGIAERILESRRQDLGLPEGGPVREYMTLEAMEYLQDRLLAGDEGKFDSRAPTTVNTMIGAVMAFVRYCYAHGWIDKVPQVPKLTVEDVMKGRPVTGEEFSAMLDSVPKVLGERPASSWQFTLEVLWESAFRVSEVMDFSWDDERKIYPVWPKRRGQRPTLVIPPTQKNRKAQEIPMLPGLHELLQKVAKDHRHGWVANPQPIDSHVRSTPDWFKPTAEDLARWSLTFSNSGIARACGVTEAAVRKWLAKTGGKRSSQSRALGCEIPIGEVSAARAGADQRIAGAAILTHRRLTKEHVGRIISRIGEEAKIIVQHEDPRTGRRRKYASAHDLRRGCAHRLINAGVSAETLKVLLRHEDFATTEKFYGATRAAQSAAAEIYEKLGKTGAEDALVGGFVGGNQQHLRLTDEELRKLKYLLARL